MVDIYRVLHPTTRQYTFFSAAHGTFSKLDHILGHKASLNTFKKTEITPFIIPDHNGVKQRNPRKYSNTWILNNTLLKNQ
jgi:exonuclease III